MQRKLVTCPEGGLGFKNIEREVCEKNYLAGLAFNEKEYLIGKPDRTHWTKKGHQDHGNPLLKRCKGCPLGKDSHLAMDRRRRDKKRYPALKRDKRQMDKRRASVNKWRVENPEKVKINKAKWAKKSRLNVSLGTKYKTALVLHAKRLKVSPLKFAADIIKERLREMAKDLK